MDQGLHDPFIGWTMTPTGSADDHAGWLGKNGPWGTTLPGFSHPSRRDAGNPLEGRRLERGLRAGKTSRPKSASWNWERPEREARGTREAHAFSPISLRSRCARPISVTSEATTDGPRLKWAQHQFLSAEHAPLSSCRSWLMWAHPFRRVRGQSASISAFQWHLPGFPGRRLRGRARTIPGRQLADAPTPLYKLTNNAPLLWILMPEMGGGAAHTYIPSHEFPHLPPRKPEPIERRLGGVLGGGEHEH